MNNELLEIRYNLKSIAEHEAKYLYRLAWKMERHGCKHENIIKVRNEARELHMIAYPERLLNPCIVWEYAFKIH